MKIKCLGLFYINGVLQLSSNLSNIAKKIPVTDDLSDFEFYEIMRLPVVQLIFRRKNQDGRWTGFMLEFFSFICFRGQLFLYLIIADKKLEIEIRNDES